MRPLLPALLLAATFWSACPAADETPIATPALTPEKAAELQALQTPEGQVKAWLKMLRKNDFTPLLTMIPAAEWRGPERAWRMTMAKQGPKADAEFNSQVAALRDPQAVDLMMAKVQPELAKIQPDQLAGQIKGAAMLVAMFGQQNAQNDPEKKAALEGLGQYLNDLATWLPTAHINDPNKAKESLTALREAVIALDLTTAEELRKKPLRDLVPKFGPALAALKKALRPYDVNLDAFIDSVRIETITGSGDVRTLTLSFTAFAKRRQLDLDLVKRGATWEVQGSEGKPFNAIAPLLGPLMQMGGGKPATLPPDDRPEGTL
jgi:hypothetical protein